MSEKSANFDTTLFRITTRRILLVLASVALAFFGWLLLDEGDALSAQERSRVGTQSPFESSAEVLAVVEGQAITRADLDPALADELADLKRREEDLYRRALRSKGEKTAPTP